MSINWRQPEIRIVINDKSHGSIDQQRWDKLLRYEFIAQFAVKKIFFKSANIRRSCRQNGWSCHTPCSPYTFSLIDRLMWVYYQQISNCCRPVSTYWYTCHQLIDCWSCTAFCCDVFFFVTAVVYNQSWWDFHMVDANIFLSVNWKKNAYFTG